MNFKKKYFLIKCPLVEDPLPKSPRQNEELFDELEKSPANLPLSDEPEKPPENQSSPQPNDLLTNGSNMLRKCPRRWDFLTEKLSKMIESDLLTKRFKS